MKQKAYSFDKETVKKIGKGALIAITGSAALGLLDYLNQLEFSNATLALVVAWLIPVLVNTVKEYIKGK